MKLGIMLGAVVLLSPLSAFAATYHYIDTSGAVRNIEAPNATVAMNNAVNLAPHSGMVLDSGVLEAGDTVTVNHSTGAVSGQYHYVDIYGVIRNIQASSAFQAFAGAVNIALHSGVTLDAGYLEAGQPVTGVK